MFLSSQSLQQCPSSVDGAGSSCSFPQENIMLGINRYTPRYEPMSELVNDLFKGFLVRPVGYGAATATGTAAGGEVSGRFVLDVLESDSTYTVQAELPGFSKQDLRIEIEADQVSITAERTSNAEARQGERVIHSERYLGQVRRSFRLGQEVDASTAQASYADGVLTLTLPKRVSVSARQITVN
jgi:HSP20 family protein